MTEDLRITIWDWMSFSKDNILLTSFLMTVHTHAMAFHFQSADHESQPIAYLIFLVSSKDGTEGIAYDWEYNSALLARMTEKSFISTRFSIFSDDHWWGQKVVAVWNRILGSIPPLRISDKNLTLLSAYNLFKGEPHKQHSKLLRHGIDAVTLRLNLASDDSLHTDGLTDYFKAVEYAYRIAESNDRAVESTYFNYLIATQTHCLLKDIIVIIGFFMFAIPPFYVCLLGNRVSLCFQS